MRTPEKLTYTETLVRLGATRRHGMKLGLETMQSLAEALGRPQDRLRFLHLAGTNGKGSTAAFCDSVLQRQQGKVGLFSSPHLISVRERVQINRVPISEEDFCQGFAAVQLAAADHATFFEIMTGIALWYFAREKVDIVVWETGLGGRLDSTNIVCPEVSVITNIGLDHREYLGDTLEEIAREKAGIIKVGVPIISAVAPGPAEEVIRQQASAAQAPLTLVDGQAEDLGLREGKQWARITGREYALGLIGPHQVENAACAVAALSHLGVAETSLQDGLASANWPGRFELLAENPLTVLDGAHNREGMEKLISTWRNFLAARGQAGQKARIVFAAVTDKDISILLNLLRPIAGSFALVHLENERSFHPADWVSVFPGLPVTCYHSTSSFWQELQSGDSSTPVLITGSLFLAGEILATRSGGGTEYRLNERLAPGSTHADGMSQERPISA